jgi:hypothetical protein
MTDMQTSVDALVESYLASYGGVDLTPVQVASVRRVAQLQALADHLRQRVLAGDAVDMTEFLRCEELADNSLKALDLPQPRRSPSKLEVCFIEPPNAALQGRTEAQLQILEALVTSEDVDGQLARAVIEADELRSRCSAAETENTELTELVTGLRERLSKTQDDLSAAAKKVPKPMISEYAGGPLVGANAYDGPVYCSGNSFDDGRREW